LVFHSSTVLKLQDNHIRLAAAATSLTRECSVYPAHDGAGATQ